MLYRNGDSIMLHKTVETRRRPRRVYKVFFYLAFRGCCLVPIACIHFPFACSISLWLFSIRDRWKIHPLWPLTLAAVHPHFVPRPVRLRERTASSPSIKQSRQWRKSPSTFRKPHLLTWTIHGEKSILRGYALRKIAVEYPPIRVGAIGHFQQGESLGIYSSDQCWLCCIYIERRLFHCWGESYRPVV